MDRRHFSYTTVKIFDEYVVYVPPLISVIYIIFCLIFNQIPLLSLYLVVVVLSTIFLSIIDKIFKIIIRLRVCTRYKYEIEDK